MHDDNGTGVCPTDPREPRTCPACGGPIAPDPRRRYCGAACRQRDHYHRQRRHLRLYADFDSAPLAGAS